MRVLIILLRCFGIDTCKFGLHYWSKSRESFCKFNLNGKKYSGYVGRERTCLDCYKTQHKYETPFIITSWKNGDVRKRVTFKSTLTKTTTD
jgi:hypothetical protein